jgi:hypothetical protein
VILILLLKLFFFTKNYIGIDVEKITPAERDYFLMEYDSKIESITNYADTAIQYGFTVLFITALPIATFFSLVSNYLKVKLNAWKLIHVSDY